MVLTRVLVRSFRTMLFKHLPMAVAVNDNDFPHLFRCVVDEQIEPKTGFARMHAMDVDNHLAALPGYLKQTENLPSGMNSEKGAESNCSLPHCKLWLLLFILARPCGLFLRLAFTLRCVAVILRFRVGVLPGCPELFRLRGQAAANLSHFAHSISALSGEMRSVDFAPVSSIILRRQSGFSSIGQGRRWLSLNG